jgi:tetratricopeptide (TPR) repeat protein
MPVPANRDQAAAGLETGNRLRARQWSRTAAAMALLFATLPLASKLLNGSWGFDGAGELAAVCAILAVYLQIAGHKFPWLRDDSSLLDRALRLAQSGRLDDAVAVLTRLIRRSPRLWQARQYRGEILLLKGDWEQAYRDFEEALRLAPGEDHLLALRARAESELTARRTDPEIS